MLMETMENGGVVRPEMLESMMKNWMPMGEASMAMWRKRFDVKP